jgi:two-component system, chemotaxis family, sensor kinase CheA
MNSGQNSQPTATELADRLAGLDPADKTGILAIDAAVHALIARSQPGIAMLLEEAAASLRAIIEGTSKDQRATAAAAVRFLRAAHVELPSAAGAIGATAPPAFVIEEGDRELVIEFVQEANDYLGQAEAAMLVLELSPSDNDAVDTVFRAFHTVKGVAAVLGFEAIAELAHKAESLLSRVRAKEIHFASNVADLSLASVDGLKSMISGLKAALVGDSWVHPDFATLNRELAAITARPVSTPAPPAGSAAGPEKRGRKGKQRKATAEPPAPASSPVEVFATHAGSLTAEPVAAPTIAASEPSGSTQAIAAASAPSRVADGAESSVRVRTERLDRLVDMVGELVIAQSMVRQDPTVVSGGHHDLSRKISHAGKIVRELQELAMSLRMVPLKPTFQKMARVVRDTAQKSGKEVELCLFGEDTEIDRNMVDVVGDPLVHMLRNAVDHGIETPAQRLALGKRRNGTVRLSATHSGGNVIVELCDDGAGLDRARIVKKAIERGLIESEAGMSDSDVFNLIFEPGFSTVEKVTDLSGRGVGMDVVRRNVQALNGRIEIASTLGQGTTFTLRLPLTLAVTDGMLVRVGVERYIVPTVNIRTSLRPTAENISTVSGKGELLLIRGELIPMFRLHRLFGVTASNADPTRALAVILNGVDGQCAILVDELLGQQQVVAKPLSQAMGTIRGIAGGAILGDGRVGLILDTPEIIALARDESRAAEAVN